MGESPYPRPGAVALVTGASSGIGRAIAERLVTTGCRVVCAARREDRLDALAADLGSDARALTLDVADADAVDSMLERLPPEWRAVDILVNAAAHDVGGRRPFHEGTAEQWASIIETNVVGLIRVTHKLIAGMLERDYGHVINIGSTSGLQPYATGTLYAGSKYAVHGFTECLRLDYANTGIRVTEILPGMVRTGFAEARLGDAAQAARFYDAFGTCLEPADVARAVGFVLEQPPQVVISQLVVVPNSQT